MLRNDLITMLAEHDNDNVVICVDGLPVDIKAVVGSGHGIEIRPDPEVGGSYSMHPAARRRTAVLDSRGQLVSTDPMLAKEISADLAAHGDAEVVVDIAGILVDVCDVVYKSRRDKVVLRVHSDDVNDALQALNKRESAEEQVDDGAGNASP